ncbi:poly-A RNA export protein DBP5 [Pelomyxa schiedti]|nr:poly-A RNA export protein DBP5 [Pelomyxa schiedti]
MSTTRGGYSSASGSAAATTPTASAATASRSASGAATTSASSTRQQPPPPQQPREPAQYEDDGDDDDDDDEVLVGDSPYSSKLPFEGLGLSQALLDGIYRKRFKRPSKIQGVTIPLILDSRRLNLLGQAPSGSGKTAAFTLGILSKIDDNVRAPQALCICPTRELALQIDQVIREFAFFTTIKIYACVPSPPGQSTRNRHIKEHVVVGTPGKIIDSITRRDLDVSHIKICVLDEADALLSAQGMADQTIRIKTFLPPCQYLLFSATIEPEIKEFATKFMPKPSVSITVKPRELVLTGISQNYIRCPSTELKQKTIHDIYCNVSGIAQSIIFMKTISGAQDLCEWMRAKGYTVSLLHGKNMEAQERDAVLKDFQDGNTRILISTNVLSRGIDVFQVVLVINYDLPEDPSSNTVDCTTYLHRIGRTGRFGRFGVAINLVANEADMQMLRVIEATFEMAPGTIKEMLPDDIRGLQSVLVDCTKRNQQQIKTYLLPPQSTNTTASSS